MRRAAARRRGPLLAVAALIASALVAAGCSSGSADRVGPGGGLDEPRHRTPGLELRRADYETGNLDQWDGAQAVARDRIRVVGDPVDQGRYAARFEVRQGDNPIDANDRAEVQLRSDAGEGDERWYAWSTMAAPGFPGRASGFQTIMQWRPAETPGPPSIGFYVEDGRILLKTNPHDADAQAVGFPEVIWSGPLDPGRWHHYALHVWWSGSDDAGALQLFVDGRRATRRVVTRTLYPGQRSYLKQGYYRSADIAPTGVVYHDALRITDPTRQAR